jgi:transcriptional regulator with XRE-family HTH domain
MMMDKGWNQSDLARSSGLGRDSISTYIRGQTFPEPKNLRKLADSLGTTTHELLPNSTLSAIESETPALEIRQAHGHLDRVFIRINQLVTLEQAARIFEILMNKI